MPIKDSWPFRSAGHFLVTAFIVLTIIMFSSCLINSNTDDTATKINDQRGKFDVFTLYKFPTGERIQVGYYNNRTYVSIPDTVCLRDLTLSSIGPMLPGQASYGRIRGTLYRPDTIVFDKVNGVNLYLQFKLLGGDEFSSPVPVYTNDLFSWLNEISKEK